MDTPSRLLQRRRRTPSSSQDGRTTGPDESNEPQAHPRDARDIAEMITYLRLASSRRISDELLKSILSYAEYDCIHFNATVAKEESHYSDGACTEAEAYVETAPLQYLSHLHGDDAVANTPRGRIRTMKFSVTGHDQGWANDADSGRWSWFEVGKRSTIASDSSSFVPLSLKRGPVLARNIRADSTWQDHEKVYHFRHDDSDDVTSAEAPLDEGEKVTSDGTWNTWCQGLQNGDQVSIIPMAEFPGWSCHVLKANIDIEVEVWY